ncbi:MAG: hypothetical protein LBS55_07070 [Prevotellaceae bacterium]|jgi:hypothetical protein|nr:hypothetical protein [Prevotellaceae bacterium]
MARELTFLVNGREYVSSPTKIDRKKLYGWTENIALDDEGNECKLVSMDESGTLIIPKGGIALGIVSDDGFWVQRSELKAVYEDGTPAKLMPSSYSVPVELSKKVSVEEFLDYSVQSFYQLDGVSDEFINFIGDDIYSFTYYYRDSYEGKTAFLLTTGDETKGKNLFMMIGILNEFEMLNFFQTSVIEEDEPEIEEEEDMEIDFSMF